MAALNIADVPSNVTVGVDTHKHSHTEAAKKAIRDARVLLDRIDVNTEGQRMRKAGEMLGMDEASRKAGEDLWRLRSKKAGHDTAEPVSTAEMVIARQVADEYLRRYADWGLAKLAGRASEPASS